MSVALFGWRPLSVSPVSPGYQLVEYRLICLQLASRSRQMHTAFSFMVSSTPFMRQPVREYSRARARERERERQRQRETERDRDRDRQTDRQTDRDIDLSCVCCGGQVTTVSTCSWGWELSTPSSSENTTASLKSSEPSTPAGMMTRFSRSVQHTLCGNCQ